MALQKPQELSGQASAWAAPVAAEVEEEAEVGAGVVAEGFEAEAEGWTEAEGASRVL